MEIYIRQRWRLILNRISVEYIIRTVVKNKEDIKYNARSHTAPVHIGLLVSGHFDKWVHSFPFIANIHLFPYHLLQIRASLSRPYIRDQSILHTKCMLGGNVPSIRNLSIIDHICFQFTTKCQKFRVPPATQINTDNIKHRDCKSKYIFLLS